MFVFKTAILSVILLFPMLGWQSREDWAWLVLALLASLGIWLGREHIQVQQNKKSALVLLGFLFLIFLPVIFSVHLRASLQVWLQFATNALVFIALWSLLADEAQRRDALGVLLGGAVAVCLYGVFVFLQRCVPNARVAANFGWYNTLAGFLVLCFPVVLAKLLGYEAKSNTDDSTDQSSKLGKYHGLIWFTASLLFGLVLGLTYSRASWLSLGIVLVTMLFWFGWQYGWLDMSKKAGLLALCILAGLKLFTQSPGLRILPQTEASGTEISSFKDAGKRWEYWQGAGQIFVDHPLTGTGGGTFGSVYPQYQTSIQNFSQTPHSFYLQFLAEQGLLGMGAMGGVLILFLARTGTKFIQRLKAKGLNLKAESERRKAKGRKHKAGSKNQNAKFKLFNTKSQKLIANRQQLKAESSGQKALLVGLAGGIIASLLHAGLDWDYEVPAIVVTLLVFIVLLLRGVETFTERCQVSGVRCQKPVIRTQQTDISTKNKGAVFFFFVGGLASVCLLGWSLIVIGNFFFHKAEASELTSERQNYIELAEKFDPLNDDYYANQAIWSVEDGNLSKALTQIEKAISLSPAYDNYYALRAHILTDLNQLQAAQASYRQALSLDPCNKPEVYIALAQISFKREGRAGALAVLEDAIKHYPLDQVIDPYWGWEQTKGDIVDIYEQLAVLYDLEGRQEEAADIFQKGLQILPGEEGIKRSFEEFLERNRD